jgi:hypothetical protein
MPKYYSLFSMNCDNPRNCYVTNIIKLSKNADIYDYLTNIYLQYKKTNDRGNFGRLCGRLDCMISKMEYENDITYDNVYEWIKNDCGEDDFDKIIVTKHKLDIV